MTSAQCKPGGHFQAAERGAFDIEKPAPVPIAPPTAPLRDFVWPSILTLGVVSFSKFYDSLPKTSA